MTETEPRRPRRSPAPRIQASADTIEAVDKALLSVQAERGRRLTKIGFADAVIAVGLAHMDEVNRRLDRPVTDP